MSKFGIFVHSRSSNAHKVADEVLAFLEGKCDEVWHTSDWDDSVISEKIPGTDALICLGGDGTMLRAARVVIPHEIPILGVNMGRLGFLAEVRPGDATKRIQDFLDNRYRLEERTMLQAQVPSWGVTYHALNDVVVGRSKISRPVYVDVSVNNSRLAVHRCDAMIVASATGSTAYSFSAGGPILHPESQDLVLTVVAPHFAASRPLVLPPDTQIDLVVSAEQDLVVSIDGQDDRTLASGDTVSVCGSPHKARFIRFSDPQDYYSLLAERLDWLRVLRASDQSELFELDGVPSPK
ncbi:MAG: NAD(+)/NADH kinase [Chloroflexi bacterium]|nr:NAD(+)/NADH kinase [Chloroflexota bacterium]